MSTKPLLLNQGGPLADILEGQRQAEEVLDLREEVAQLRQALQDKATELRQEREISGRAVQRVRSVLLPLHTSLCELFDEMDRVKGVDASAPANPDSVNPRQRAIWDSWKRKLGGKAADMIEALLLHGEMSTQAVAVAIGCHRNNVPKVAHKLNQAGILRKNGTLYALKTN